MDYLRFVELRAEAWDDFEKRLADARSNPRTVGFAGLERLAVSYRQILHDHALAAARYPGTSAARRLHRLVLDGTHWLQRDPADRLPTLRRFFFESFPRAFAACRSSILAVTGLFLAAALFGLVLAAARPALGAYFVGPDSVDGLREGRLWTESVFSTAPRSLISSRIATNNLGVAMTGWAGGALAGLGAIYIVFLNGLMLGAVVALTAHYSMAGSLGEFVAAHGPLEITLILVSAGAGLEMGRALVGAGDRPRLERLQRAGRTSLIVLAGSLPWVLLLGFVEGFVSPSVEVPLAAKVALGLVLVGLYLSLASNRFSRGTP